MNPSNGERRSVTRIVRLRRDGHNSDVYGTRVPLTPRHAVAIAILRVSSQHPRSNETKLF